MSVVKRIKQYIDFKGITNQKFEQQIGYSNGAFATQVKNNKNIGSDKLENILNKYADINPIWLLTGKGEMLLNSRPILEDDSNVMRVEEPIAAYNKKGIPLLPIEAMAGVFRGDIQVMDYECEYIYIPMFKDASFYIPVLGDSMYPTYNNGDVVACRQLESWTFFQPGRVYVIYTSQGVIVKRVKKGSTDGSILIISDNDNYPPFELPKKEILGVALVIGGMWLE